MRSDLSTIYLFNTMIDQLLYQNYDIHYDIITYLGWNYHQLSYHNSLLNNKKIYHNEIVELRDKKRLVALITFYYMQYNKIKDTITMQVYAANFNVVRCMHGIPGLGFSR